MAASYNAGLEVYDIYRGEPPDQDYIMTVCDVVQANETAARLAERSGTHYLVSARKQGNIEY